MTADHYQRVTLIERDPLPDFGEHRKGVPHGKHLHGLHPRGREILDELLPGFTDKMVASGAVRCDMLNDVRFQIWGHQFFKAPGGLPGCSSAGHSSRRTFASTSAASPM